MTIMKSIHLHKVIIPCRTLIMADFRSDGGVSNNLKIKTKFYFAKTCSEICSN